MVRASRSAPPKVTTNQLIEQVVASSDALFIREAISHIEESSLSLEDRDSAIKRIIDSHADKTIVVTRCLSALARSESGLLRPLCRTLINAPFDADKEDVIAFAATLLAQMPTPERVDMLLLAKAVDHCSLCVRNAARRALENLSTTNADALLALAREVPEKPPIALLKRHLSGEDWRSKLTLPNRPPIPKQTYTEEIASTKLPHDLRARPNVLPRNPVAHGEAPRPNTHGVTVAVGSPRRVPTDQELLTPHRLADLRLCSDSFLTNEIALSTDNRRVAAALAEYTVRHGPTVALKFNRRLMHGLMDPSNTERARFVDIALCWFPELDRRQVNSNPV